MAPARPGREGAGGAASDGARGGAGRYELQREVQELKQAAHAIADAARARAVRRAAPSEALEGEVGTLASEMSQLTKAVGVISAAERTGGTPKEGIRQLAGAVASLTGRVADLHHSRAFRDSFASRAAAGEPPPPPPPPPSY